MPRRPSVTTTEREPSIPNEHGVQSMSAMAPEPALSRYRDALNLAAELHGNELRKAWPAPWLAHWVAVSSLVGKTAVMRSRPWQRCIRRYPIASPTAVRY